MRGAALKQPQPLLSVNHWCRHSWNALRHKRSGIIVVFHGANPTRARNETLRRLNKMAPTPTMRVEHIGSL
jgi:hypothetical protein